MKDILILGAGGHGKVVSDVAKSMEEWRKISFLDDDAEKISTFINEIEVIGKIEDFSFFKKNYKYAFVAIGDNKLRMELISKLKKDGFNIPILIHKFSFLSENVDIGEGTVIMPGVVVNNSTRIGRGCIINTSSCIEHDCVINDGVHISPGTVIAGNVEIGKQSWICLGAKIINNLKLGDSVVVAAGSVVIEDIKNNCLVAGVPAKIKKNYNNL